jgi:hypothetical protein
LRHAQYHINVICHQVDVSCCHKLGDVDLGVMATNCPKVRKLNLRDAKQLSDLALVEVRTPPPRFGGRARVVFGRWCCYRLTYDPFPPPPTLTLPL